MGNHVHIILVAYDAQDCVNFYQELQKKITDAFKRLLGKKKLSLWEGEPVLAEILDFEKMIEKITYLYANPASASLTESVTEYPGISSWESFRFGIDSSMQNIPWIRLPAIPKLSSLTLSSNEDSKVLEQMTQFSTLFHSIEISPDAWMKCFDIHSEDEINEINKRIFEQIIERETVLKQERLLEKRTVIGVQKLIKAPLMKSHEPRQRERRVYVHSSDKELRISFIQMIKEFCRKCAECYQLFKRGELVTWPPGAFRPHAPPLASVLG